MKETVFRDPEGRIWVVGERGVWVNGEAAWSEKWAVRLGDIDKFLVNPDGDLSFFTEDDQEYRTWVPADVFLERMRRLNPMRGF